LNKYQAEIHRLKLWLNDNNLNQQEFAIKVKKHPNYISMIFRFERTPGRSLAMTIEEKTEGYVKARDLRPEDKSLKKWNYNG
jgi:transcriptional regulator with XRE-family HTH domain